MTMSAKWSQALVTGASSGSGAALVEELARAGADLVLVARSQDVLEERAADLRTRYGVDVEVLVADLTDADDLARVEDRLRAGDVDLLVNNAGFGSLGAFADLPADREEQVVRINVLAPMRLCRAALEPMRAARRGTILNMSSFTALEPVPWFANYSATKAYLLNLSQALAEELRGTGVTVTAVCPGPVATAFSERAGLLDPPLRGRFETPSSVAVAALRGAAAGRRVVLPGPTTAVLAAIAKIAPTNVTTFLNGRLGRLLMGGRIDEAAARAAAQPSGPTPDERSLELDAEPAAARASIDRGSPPVETPSAHAGKVPDVQRAGRR